MPDQLANQATPTRSPKGFARNTLSNKAHWSGAAIVLLIIFIAEAFTMLLLGIFFSDVSGWREGLLDATILVALSAPILYWVLIRPQRRRAEQAEYHEAAVLESVADSILTLDPQMRILTGNSAARQAFGYDANTLVGMNAAALFVDFEGDQRVNAMAQVISGGGAPGTDTFESEALQQNGKRFSAQVGLYPLANDEKNGFTLVVRDISRRKLAEQNLKHQALHDSLTGLINRNGLNEPLREAIATNRVDTTHDFSVLFLDFDRFKIINDSLGHEAGDQLLISIASRLNQHLGEEDVASRLGGDEFVVLWRWRNEPDIERAAKQRVDELLAALTESHQVAGQQVVSTASIGMLPTTRNYQHAADMLRDTDAAMYHAKAAGKARCVVFDESMHDEANQRLQLENDLRNALERGELSVFYQPIISTETGRVQAMEAILRWRQPDGSYLHPTQFIEVAEETGLIIEIGVWVIHQALAQLTAWRDHIGCDELFVAINFSRSQLANTQTLDTLRQGLEQLDIDPRSVQIDLEESTLMNLDPDVTDGLNTLETLGVQIALDNFGTGQTALRRLHQLPVQTLKIDRDFIRNMEGQMAYAAVVHSIVTLAHNLGLTVVAEGVETAAQFAEIQALEANLAQGHYVAAPMAADEATNLLEMEAADILAMGA
jgi:diguanylate cyclase (GGDEF)-like protein/PAS domain S-box-containing protein